MCGPVHTLENQRGTLAPGGWCLRDTGLSDLSPPTKPLLPTSPLAEPNTHTHKEDMFQRQNIRAELTFITRLPEEFHQTPLKLNRQNWGWERERFIFNHLASWEEPRARTQVSWLPSWVPLNPSAPPTSPWRTPLHKGSGAGEPKAEPWGHPRLPNICLPTVFIPQVYSTPTCMSSENFIQQSNGRWMCLASSFTSWNRKLGEHIASPKGIICYWRSSQAWTGEMLREQGFPGICLSVFLEDTDSREMLEKGKKGVRGLARRAGWSYWQGWSQPDLKWRSMGRFGGFISLVWGQRPNV